MKKLFRFLRMEFVPTGPDLALLALRAWLGITMLINHGLGKLATFPGQAVDFPDPLGVGPHVSMALAVLGEVICSALLVLGLFGRLAALGLGATMAVAFFLVHGGALTGASGGELAFVYLAGFVALFLAGPGSFSMDTMLAGASRRSVA
jgi:putative oxidoreductase